MNVSMSIVILGLTSSLLLSACSKTITFQDAEQQNTPQQPQLKIRAKVDKKLLTLEDKWEGGLGGTAVVRVGEALTPIFDPDPSSEIEINYVSSDLSTKMSDFLLLWSSSLTAYKIVVVINEPNGKRTIVEGTGQGVSYSGWPAKEAVEKAVVDLHKKIIAILDLKQ